MTIAVDLGRKATKPTNQPTNTYKNGMIGHGGERCQNAQKHFMIKAY